jgi:cysteine desulfurase / selenocysteine lyase
MTQKNNFKKDFPIFQQKKNGKPLIYLDNAATTQKPKSVITSILTYYEKYNANIHRGVYTISEKSTQEYENVREKTQKFFNAKSSKEIIFTKNTTESINLLAYTLGENHIKKDDEIIISELEHHSNLVPWQELAKRNKAKLKIIPIKSDYSLDLDIYKSLLTKKTKLISVTAMSNTLGTQTDLETIIKEAHKKNALVIVDGAQISAHKKINLQKLDCDFFTTSAHKMFGPTGVGILYGKEKILKKLPPFLFGGDMIKTVSLSKAVYADLPAKFEAGTPNISGVIGFGEALKYLEKIGFDFIKKTEKELFEHALNRLSKIEQIKLFVPPKKKAGPIISFTVKGIHPHDLATIFNEENICIRAGQHCTEPLMKKLGVMATARISFCFYNTKEEIDKTCETIQKAIKLFG